jgi:hypothetical protein
MGKAGPWQVPRRRAIGPLTFWSRDLADLFKPLRARRRERAHQARCRKG